jgi:SAM-dependent methyltransferase
MSDPHYPGGELDLFAHAHHWKRYWSAQVQPYIRGAVLEVGAGIGSNTVVLRTATEGRWLCLEPDPLLAARLTQTLRTSAACSSCEVRTGVISSLGPDELFDTLLYIDVLEHIADDHDEIRRAASHLKPGGHLIVLSPAHHWLFSPFDQAIGHCRRYSRQSLTRLTIPELRFERAFYLDAVGLLASLANRLLLRQSMPDSRQLAFWDRCLVPLSRVVDMLIGRRLGKSVVCIWKRRP